MTKRNANSLNNPSPALPGILSHKGRGKQRAFTLIELLVVVLIIGILAAVAVPQYQKVVLKARMTQAFLFGKEYVKAQNVYRLANGEFADSLDKLDIQLAVPTGWTIRIIPNDGLYITHTSSAIFFNFWPAGSIFSQNAGSGYCIVEDSASQLNTAKAVCQGLTENAGIYESSKNRYLYKFQW